jgi:hypothetical protein
MIETMISRESFEHLKDRAEQMGRPVQELVDAALEQFIKEENE